MSYNWKKMIGKEVKGFKILDYKREGTNSVVYAECPFCGGKKWVRTSNLIDGRTKSCGCREGRFIDLTEKHFNFLTAKYPTGELKGGYRVWHCVCECGGTKDVSSQKLMRGDVKSCGCLDKESRIKNGKKAAEKTIKEHCIDGTNYKTITSKMYCTNTSGTKGISQRKSNGMWRASIGFKGERYEKVFKEKKDAIKWRKEKEEELFGNFFEEHKELQERWKKYKNGN